MAAPIPGHPVQIIAHHQQVDQDQNIASEDRGYVRLKTLSSPYIVPVQIDRNDLELVNEARAAAGDPPLTPSVGS